MRVVYGVQPVREVLRAHGSATSRVFLAESDNPKLEGLARLAASRGVPVSSVSRAELDRRTKGGMHQGALAEAPELVVLDQDGLLERVRAAPEPPTVIVLDGIMDPQNFGAVVRGAVALGAPFVVWPEHGSAPLSPATFRASAGAIEHATLVRVRALPSLVTALHEVGFTSILLEGSSQTRIEEIDLTGPALIVVGAEDKGAKPAVRKAVKYKVQIPMTGVIDSLNASVAAALALYETSRQRRVGRP